MDNRLLKVCSDEFQRYIENLDSAKPDCLGMLTVRTPWCDDYTIFTPGIPHLKFKIRAALNAQAWFYKTGPSWAQPLPLNAREYVVMMRCGGPWYLLAGETFSFSVMDYYYSSSPIFFDAVCGVMLTSVTPAK